MNISFPETGSGFNAAQGCSVLLLGQLSARLQAQHSPAQISLLLTNPTPHRRYFKGEGVCVCVRLGGGVEINNKVGSMDCAYICYWIEIRGIPNY